MLVLAVVDRSFVSLGPRKELCLSLAPTEKECRRWCKDGCLDENLVCDGKSDCPNGLDEYNCELPDGEITAGYSYDSIDDSSFYGLSKFLL